MWHASRPYRFWLLLLAALAQTVLAGWLAWRVPGVAALSRASGAWSASLADPRPLRVLLSTGPEDTWQLRIDGPYRVQATGDWRILAQGERLERATARHASGAEGAEIRIGDRAFAADHLEVRPLRDGTLWVNGTRYRGYLRLLRRPRQQLAAVNVVDVEAYLASVLACEMQADFPEAALQAQAIASRGYALYQMKQFGATHDFDLYSTARSQVYRGMEYPGPKGERWRAETPRTRGIVEQTRGVVLTFHGRLFCSYYSAVCGGRTTHGRQVFADAAPTLVDVACDHCRDATRYRWQRAVPWEGLERQVRDYLQARGRTLGKLTKVQVAQATSAPAHDQRANEVLFSDEQGVQAIRVDEFQLQVLTEPKLPSPRFAVEPANDHLLFLGQGWGHGVGMCQWGARRLALDGSDCAEILALYYPGSELTCVR